MIVFYRNCVIEGNLWDAFDSPNKAFVAFFQVRIAFADLGAFESAVPVSQSVNVGAD